MASLFEQHARRRILLLDGAMGTSLYARDLTVAHYSSGGNSQDKFVNALAETRFVLRSSFDDVGDWFSISSLRHRFLYLN